VRIEQLRTASEMFEFLKLREPAATTR